MALLAETITMLLLLLDSIIELLKQTLSPSFVIESCFIFLFFEFMESSVMFTRSLPVFSFCTLALVNGR